MVAWRDQISRLEGGTSVPAIDNHKTSICNTSSPPIIDPRLRCALRGGPPISEAPRPLQAPAPPMRRAVRSLTFSRFLVWCRTTLSCQMPKSYLARRSPSVRNLYAACNSSNLRARSGAQRAGSMSVARGRVYKRQELFGGQLCWASGAGRPEVAWERREVRGEACIWAHPGWCAELAGQWNHPLAMHWHHTATALRLPWCWCAGIALLLHWCCAGTTLWHCTGLHRYNLGTILGLHKYCTGNATQRQYNAKQHTAKLRASPSPAHMAQLRVYGARRAALGTTWESALLGTLVEHLLKEP